MKLLLNAACCLMLVGLGLPLGLAQAQHVPTSATVENAPAFEVSTIKPSRPGGDQNWNRNGDRLSIENYTLRLLIFTAYGLKSESQVLGGPDWIGKQAFDIEAKFSDAELAKIQNLSGQERPHEIHLAVQSLLAERFRLQAIQDTRSIPVYALVVAKTGAKLTPSAAQLDSDGKPKIEKDHSVHAGNGHMTATAISMNELANYLPESDRMIVDKTGLSGDYDIKLNWTQDQGQGDPSDASLPGLFTALREQLGLELKPDKAPVDVVVVESATQPSVN